MTALQRSGDVRSFPMGSHTKIFPPRAAIASRFGLLVTAGFALLLAAACSRSERPRSVEAEWQEAVRPVSESWDVRYTVSESGSDDPSSRPRLAIMAGYMATFDTDSTYTLLRASDSSDVGSVRATIFDAVTGDTAAVVVASRIVYREEERRFEAAGDVVVEGRRDRRLQSERLFWDERNKSIFAPGFVRIETPKERIEGYNLDSDEDLNNYTLARVTGEAEIDEEDDLQ